MIEMEKKILIIGGYGHVGSTIVAQLSKQFPGQVIAAGRNFAKAEALALELDQNVIPIELDITNTSAKENLFDEVGLVIMCLDLENIEFARQCIQRGIHYIDISASYQILAQIECLQQEAEKSGASVVLSVGLAPGLTNLLAKHCKFWIKDMTKAEIYVMLGSGEAHGEASIHWTLENLDGQFSVHENGETKPVKSFEDGKQVLFPEPIGKRTAYRFNFSDQHVIPQTLSLQSASTRICFDSTLITRLLAVIKKTGLSPLLTMSRIKGFITSLLKRVTIGSDEFAIKVEAGYDHNHEVLYECSLRGTGEGQITGLVAAKVAEKLVRSSLPTGVFHIEQLFDLIEFKEIKDLQFKEKMHAA